MSGESPLRRDLELNLLNTLILADGTAAAPVSGLIGEMSLVHLLEKSGIAVRTVEIVHDRARSVRGAAQGRDATAVVPEKLGNLIVMSLGCAREVEIECVTEIVSETVTVTVIAMRRRIGLGIGAETGSAIVTGTERETENVIGPGSVTGEIGQPHEPARLLLVSETRKIWRSGRWRKSGSERRRPRRILLRKRTQERKACPFPASATGQQVVTSPWMTEYGLTPTATFQELATTGSDVGVDLAAASVTVKGTVLATESAIEIVSGTGNVTATATAMTGFGTEIGIGIATEIMTVIVIENASDDAEREPCLLVVTDGNAAAADGGAGADAGEVAARNQEIVIQGGYGKRSN